MFLVCLSVLIIIKIIIDGLYNWIQRNTAKMTQIVETMEDNLNHSEFMDTPGLSLENPIPNTIYIDREISFYLSVEKCDPKVEFAYVVDNKVCNEAPPVDEEYVQFEMYASNVDDIDSDESSDDDDQEFECSTEMVPQGVIINSIIFLLEYNWHTILTVEGKLGKCTVCDVFTCLDYSDKHKETYNHKLHLSRYKPLMKYDLNIIRKINNTYHCGQCNELFALNEIDIHFDSQNHEKCLLLSINKATTILNHNETNNNLNIKNNDFFNDISDDSNDTCKGISYASVVKKPKAFEMPKFLSKDLGDKKIKILFDSWHMITVTNAITFHCMACNKSEHIRYKTQHSMNVEHVENLMKCTVVEDFKDHLVRRVNNSETLYHCGHCNNIHYKSEMEFHINIMHQSKYKVNERKMSLSSSSSRENMLPILDNTTKNENVLSNDNNALNNDKTKNMPETDKITISLFGYRITIPILSYNVIINNPSLCCGLCAKPLNNNEISLHMQDLNHIQLLQTTNYISFHGINTIRSIPGYLHCTICNVPIPPLKIFVHNAHDYHRQLLAKTFNIPLNRLPSFAAPPPLPSPNRLQFHTPFELPYAPQILPYAPQTLPYAPQTLPYAPQTLPYAPQTLPYAPLTLPYAPGTLPHTPQNLPYMPQIISIQNTQYIQSNNGYQQPNVHLLSPPIGENRARSPLSRNQSAPISEINGARNTTSGYKTDNNETNVLGEKNPIGAESAIGANGASKLKSKALRVGECQNDDTESDDNLDESMDSVDLYNTEEYIYLKLKNIYFKITFSSYNTLVHMGDGGRYCFICSNNVVSDLKKHVESRSHLENIDKYHFVDKYEKHLLRQVYFIYHCSICNVIFKQKELKNHIEWPTHTLEMNIAQSIPKKTRRKDVDSGIKQFIIKTVKEQIYLNTNTTNKTNILMNFKISKHKDTDCQTLGKNKIISFKNKVLKFNFANWHGITKINDKMFYFCIICDINIDGKDVSLHVELESHKNNLIKPFDSKYFPALIRPVNHEKSNCIFCNVKLLNSHIDAHIRAKRHQKIYDSLLKESATINNYENCEEDMLTV